MWFARGRGEVVAIALALRNCELRPDAFQRKEARLRAGIVALARARM